MSRRWRRSLERQRLRDDADRAALEERIMAAVRADAEAKDALSPRDSRGYEGPKKDEQISIQLREVG